MGERSNRRLFDDRFAHATTIFDVRKERWDTDQVIQGGPKSRRNPTYARLGRHMIISGGFDDATSQSLEDTWSFDASRRVWMQLSCPAAPALEGHKSIVSGFDVFSFGGHTAPGVFS